MATATLPLDLGGHGLDPEREVHRNLSVPELVEHAVRLDEGILVASGALRATTGERTGRSPDAKRVAKDPAFEDTIWWGAVNKPVDPEAFDRFHEKVAAYLSKRPLYVFDGYAGADPEHRIGVRVVNERAWHNLFAHQLFLRPTAAELEDHAADFTILHAPGLQADPADGSGDTAAVFLSFEKRLILIAGTEYAGEMKKSIFTVMNGLMPRQGVLPMHCSANVGPDGDVVLFFGLSGTGKTTLSADPERRLIGDDEHGWSGSGVFNFEGGCYAKTIKLSAENEPQIWAAIRFGSVLENVAVDDERGVDYDDASITENTRAGYPVDYIPNAMIPGVGGHPKTIVFLTADAFGVLPPIARLSREQAMYHFVSGYTAKVAGTEKGVTEPKATFSACFGAPFLPLHPTTYAEMLGDRIDRVGATVWLVNTGWTGGPYGTGHRMDLPSTRAMVRAALSGELSRASFRTDPIFGFEVPESVPDVDSAILDPRSTWSDGAAYDEKARDLARRFRENYEKYDEGGKAAGGPTV